MLIQLQIGSDLSSISLETHFDSKTLRWHPWEATLSADAVPLLYFPKSILHHSTKLMQETLRSFSDMPPIAAGFYLQGCTKRPFCFSVMHDSDKLCSCAIRHKSSSKLDLHKLSLRGKAFQIIQGIEQTCHAFHFMNFKLIMKLLQKHLHSHRCTGWSR